MIDYMHRHAMCRCVLYRIVLVQDNKDEFKSVVDGQITTAPTTLNDNESLDLLMDRYIWNDILEVMEMLMDK